jgi:hypothetical protein
MIIKNTERKKNSWGCPKKALSTSKRTASKNNFTLIRLNVISDASKLPMNKNVAGAKMPSA